MKIDEIHLVKEDSFGLKDTIDWKYINEDHEMPIETYINDDGENILEIKVDVLESLGYKLVKIL